MREASAADVRFRGPTDRFYAAFVSSSSNSGTFVYFDGDDVGAHIELHLLRNEIEGSAALSAYVVKAVGEISDEIRTQMDGTVIFAAGDEILAILPKPPSVEAIDQLRSGFTISTGLTISCGIGATAAEAARNLHLAKLLGKNRLHGTVRA